MSTTMPQQKITYTTTGADMGAFHAAYDAALAKVRGELGRSHSLKIAGKDAVSKRKALTGVSAVDRSVVMGKFAAAGPEHVDAAVKSAREGFELWRKTPWQKRTAILRKAAEGIRAKKYELAALMSLEVGKSRMEAMGDAEESADLIDYYCAQVEDTNGFTRKMGAITQIETNTDILRPFGVFAVISPFNFPLALPCGMSSAALAAGNSVVFKPAEDAMLTGWKLWEIYIAAGVPASAFQFLTGEGSVMGDALTGHPGVDGVAFTGSAEVGMRIFRRLSKNWVKPCLMEMGGKNAAVVMDSADLEAASDGIVKSAFGLQGQKCSACSRVYAHKKIAGALIEKIVAKAKALKLGDVTQKDVYFGPVINAASVKKFKSAVAAAKKDGKVLLGGKELKGGIFDKGFYLEPTVVKAPLSSKLFVTEYFAPFVAVAEVESLDQAIAETNKAPYGLTSGIFSAEAEEIETFFDRVEAGVSYANKRSGATTGAWPGAQSFTGWKASGSTGKGGCGPYYVQQFMREQCRTIIQEK